MWLNARLCFFIVNDGSGAPCYKIGPISHKTNEMGKFFSGFQIYTSLLGNIFKVFETKKKKKSRFLKHTSFIKKLETAKFLKFFLFLFCVGVGARGRDDMIIWIACDIDTSSSIMDAPLEWIQSTTSLEETLI